MSIKKSGLCACVHECVCRCVCVCVHVQTGLRLGTMLIICQNICLDYSCSTFRFRLDPFFPPLDSSHALSCIQFCISNDSLFTTISPSPLPCPCALLFLTMAAASAAFPPSYLQTFFSYLRKFMFSVYKLNSILFLRSSLGIEMESIIALLQWAETYNSCPFIR